MVRRVLTLALVPTLLIVLVALTPLAYADPPDPTWVSGFFDDDDNDNGVFLVTSDLAALDAFAPCWSLPVPVLGRRIALEDPGPVCAPYPLTSDARAPPLS